MPRHHLTTVTVDLTDFMHVDFFSLSVSPETLLMLCFLIATGFCPRLHFSRYQTPVRPSSSLNCIFLEVDVFSGCLKDLRFRPQLAFLQPFFKGERRECQLSQMTMNSCRLRVNTADEWCLCATICSFIPTRTFKRGPLTLKLKQ